MHIDFINPVNISSHTRIHKKNIIDHHRKFQRKKNTSSNKNYWQPICFITKTDLWHVIAWNIWRGEKTLQLEYFVFVGYLSHILILTFFSRGRIIRLTDFCWSIENTWPSTGLIAPSMGVSRDEKFTNIN